MASIAIVARHGRTAWNVVGRIQGHQGDDLDEVGEQQADALGWELLAKYPSLDLIVSSDLPRAEQTGRIVAEILDIPIETDIRLRECGFGVLEGLTREKVLADYGHRMELHLNDRTFNYDFSPFGGERRAQVITRHVKFLRELRQRDDVRSVLIIGHGRSLNNLLMAHYPRVSVINDNCEYRLLNL